MNKILLPDKMEKIIEENALFIHSVSKFIIKNGEKRISISLNNISNIRLVKNRVNQSPIAVLFFMFFIYVVGSKFLKVTIELNLLYLSLSSILFILSFSIKNYNYTLLINQGVFCFDEIIIDNRNRIYAKKLVAKFKLEIVTNRNQIKIQNTKKGL